MSLQGRIAVCDMCENALKENSYGDGWPGWAILNGIGAKTPQPDEPLTREHTESYLCIPCSGRVSAFITKHGSNSS